MFTVRKGCARVPEGGAAVSKADRSWPAVVGLAVVLLGLWWAVR